MDLQVRPEIPDRKVPQVIVECPDFRDQVVNRALEDSAELQVNQVNRVSLATMDHRVCQELPDRRDLQDHRVTRVSKDQWESLVRRELLAALEIRVQLVQLVHRVYRVLRGCLVLRDRKVRLDRPENGDCGVKRDRRVLMDRRVREENQAHLAWKVPRVMPEKLARRVSRVIGV